MTQVNKKPSLPGDLEEAIENVWAGSDDLLFEEIEEYEKALELGFENADILCNLGAAYEVAKQADKAIQSYSRALELDSNHTEARYYRAILYHKIGKLDEAITDFKQLAMMPGYQQVAHFWLATAYGKKRRELMNRFISSLLSPSSKG